MPQVGLEIEVVEQLKQAFGRIAGVDAIFGGDADPEAGAEGLVREVVDDGVVFQGLLMIGMETGFVTFGNQHPVPVALMADPQ